MSLYLCAKKTHEGHLQPLVSQKVHHVSQGASRFDAALEALVCATPWLGVADLPSLPQHCVDRLVATSREGCGGFHETSEQQTPVDLVLGGGTGPGDIFYVARVSLVRRWRTAREHFKNEHLWCFSRY